MFDMEYWSLEQAKLGERSREAARRARSWRSPARAAAIGAATAKAFAAAGAEVALLDVDEDAATDKAQGDRRRALALACDVTDAASVTQRFDRIAETFGGVDIVVSNAGAAWQGRIGEVDEARSCARASS